MAQAVPGAALAVPGAEPAQVPSLVLAPPAARAWLVLGHGAGAGMQHANMVALAEAFAGQGIATLRFEFPFMVAGRRRVDAQDVAVATVRAAVSEGVRLAGNLPLWLGGHSFGGRMASHAAAEDPELPTQGLLYCNFPLHTAKNPGTKRADHLAGIHKPQRLCSGDRDALAERDLLEPVVAGLPDGALHWLHTANHSYTVLKRTRTATETVFDELARVAAGWLLPA